MRTDSNFVLDFENFENSYWEYEYDTVPVIDYIDTTVTRKRFTNFEYGIYAGIDKKFLNETLLLNATARIDKNQNFDYLISPAASLVWKASEKDLFRFSFSSALRNPTSLINILIMIMEQEFYLVI